MRNFIDFLLGVNCGIAIYAHLYHLAGLFLLYFILMKFADHIANTRDERK